MIIQTPWIERKFEYNFPVGLFPVIVERLKGTLPRVEDLIKNKSDESLSRKLSGAWSIKEQIGHLYDMEELWYGRIEDFLAAKETLRAADMTNAKTHGASHNDKSIDEVVNQFADARNKLISKIEHFDEAAASTTAFHPRLQKPMRLVDSLFFVAEHDDHHLAKIRELVNSE